MKKILSMLGCAALGVALLASPALADDAQTPPSAPETAVEVQTPPEPVIVDESPAPVADVPAPVVEPAAPEQVAVESAPQETGHDPVTFCHKPGEQNQKTLTTDDDGFLQGHLGHGDTLGECAPIQTPALVTEWHTWLSPTYTPDATDASGIGWDQTYLGAGQIAPPACSTTVQQDLYTGTREQIDAVLADGVLTNVDGTIEDHALVQDWNIVSSDPCPVVTNACTPGQGDTSTNLNDLWTNVDTRSAGHLEYVDGGLHVWTDDNSSQAKVSEGRAANFPLHDTGTISLDWTGSTPPPGVNLFVNFGADGTGTLVYESVYGQDLWLTNGSSAAVKAHAPVNGGGNGSQWHGTIDQWLTAYPDATVTGFAYSLGSGVLGGGVIHSVTVNCATYAFDYEREVPVQPEPTVSTETWFEVICVEPNDGTALVTEYRQDTTTPKVFDTEAWAWVDGEPVVGEVYVASETKVHTDKCAAPTPTPTVIPTETPSATPSATPVAQVHTVATLASTGTNLGVIIAVAGLLILAGFIAFMIAARKNRDI